MLPFCATIHEWDEPAEDTTGHAMSRQIRTQNLRDFTVQIGHPVTGAIIGNGVVVALQSEEGEIVTCGQVVRAAGLNPDALAADPQALPAAASALTVSVIFPQARDDERRAHRATLAAAVAAPGAGDLLVLLRLTDGPVPLAPEHVAIPGPAAAAQGHDFRSFGYTAAPEAPMHGVDGTIIGLVGTPPTGLIDLTVTSAVANPSGWEGLPGAALLDIEQNLVVGILCTPPRAVQLGSPTLQALDLGLLEGAPLRLRRTPQPPPPEPRSTIAAAEARQLVSPVVGPVLYGPPPKPAAWRGRADLLRALESNYADPRYRITVLVGSSGAGKSSLAHQWVSNLVRGQGQPDGIFWWSFTARPGVDECFAAMLAHLGGRMIDNQRYPSAAVRAQLVAAMLATGRYLFVLDGLEVLQHRQGDRAGLLTSPSLRALLHALAGPGHDSYCLITSQVPLLDLLDRPACIQRRVGRLSANEGRLLLADMGVRGPQQALERLVTDLDGHAMGLVVAGSYLATAHNGDIAGASDLPRLAQGARIERIIHMLLPCFALLDAAGQALLRLLAAFRLPVDAATLERLCRPQPGLWAQLLRSKPHPLLAPIARLKPAAYKRLLARLVEARLLDYDPTLQYYGLHPLVRACVAAHLDPPLNHPDTADLPALHLLIRDDYIAAAGQVPRFASLSDLEPLIEAVAHTCRAGAYDDAFALYWERVEQGDHRILAYQLGAYTTLLRLLAQFMPAGNLTDEPLVTDPATRLHILETIGFCLVNTGRLREAVACSVTRNRLLQEAGDWHNLSVGYQNLATLSLQLGDLAAAAPMVDQALDLARQTGNPTSETAALARRAWLAHLRGDLDAASSDFRQAEALQRTSLPEQPHLYSQEGVWHASHLRQTGARDEARRIIQASLARCERNGWLKSASQAHRVLADLDADEAQHAFARQHYDEALRLARMVDHPLTLVEALLGRGRWRARSGSLDAARQDLREALDYALTDGYRMAEVEVRHALALLHTAAADPAAAQAEEAYAQHLSALLGLRPLDAPQHG